MIVPDWLINGPATSSVPNGSNGPAEVASTDISVRFSRYIVSSSGIRAVMASGGEEDDGGSVDPEDVIIAYLIGYTGAAFLFGEAEQAPVAKQNPQILFGRDSRPTGERLAWASMAGAAAATPATTHPPAAPLGYLDVCPSPQIMAYARGLPEAVGFVYVSASHNPVGHNGYKIGGLRGGVLGGDEFRRFASILEENIRRAEELFTPSPLAAELLAGVTAAATEEQRLSKASYRRFLLTTIFDTPDLGTAEALSRRIASQASRRPISLTIDFNGSARAAGPDVDLLGELGIEVSAVNAEPGKIAHQILPEGPGLATCMAEVERQGRESSEPEDGKPEPLVIGCVPDNDGDRGNIVVFNPEKGQAEAIHPQTLLTLAALAELGYDAAGGPAAGLGESAAATSQETPEGHAPRGLPTIIANGPTSLRLDRAVENLGASVFRSEVGEANVVSLAVKMRGEGRRVRVMGEGSNGGVIIHPSAVRDPLLTLGALIKLVRLPELSPPDREPLGALYAGVPDFITTQTGDPDAMLRLDNVDHPRLKANYEALAEARWEELFDLLPSGLGVQGYRWVNYEGRETLDGRGNRSPAATGGLKLELVDVSGRARGFLWFRGSKTEALLRLMVDLEGDDVEAYKRVIAWHRSLVLEAARAG